ncbi:hypothetical protein LguiA_010384 [Lonicera macranthoides]
MAVEGEVQFDNIKSEGDNGVNLTTKTRIYVGGLGGTVNEDDLRKTFSPLGKLDSVEIVRTKGRSFAYLDFLPSSQKSLAKLFSTYNGCMWKGGRLRLEKAKEHYLNRLKREWIEAAELASNAPSSDADVSENMGSFKKPKKVPAVEKPQLRFFFPKLMKMKSLPFRGTGKHKYSFQRVEVPSLPIHFCDCEEHSDSCDTIKEKPFVDLETDVGINEEELDLMKSVMNKLFEKENCTKAAGGEAVLAKEGGHFVSSVDDMPVDENDNEADVMSDEDNLVINIVTEGNDRLTSSGSQGQEKTTNYQESKFNKPRSSKQRAVQKMHEHERKKIAPYDKKRKSSLTEESEGNEIPSSAPKKKKNSQIHSSEPEDQAAEPKSSTQQSKHSFMWSQKSAWKNLVGKTGNTPFSISQILPNAPSSKEEQPELNNLDLSNSTKIKKPNLVKHGNSESQLGPSKEVKELAECAPKQPKLINFDVSESTEVKEQEFSKHGNSESPSQEVKELDEAAPIVPNAVLNSTSGRGAAWKQKSSWTQLISNTNTSSFSISQVLPGLNFEKQRALEAPNDVDAVNSNDNEQHNTLKSKRSEFRTFELANKDLIITAPCGSNVNALANKENTSEEKLMTMGEKNEVSASTKQTFGEDFGNGETCPFMRSDASMKEWMKTKAALSGSLKKKGNEK